MVRSVTTFDAEWPDEDRAWLMAWIEDDEHRCGGCNLPRSETFDPEHAGNYYNAEPWVCHACAARDRAQRQAREQKLDADGLNWAITERG